MKGYCSPLTADWLLGSLDDSTNSTLHFTPLVLQARHWHWLLLNMPFLPFLPPLFLFTFVASQSSPSCGIVSPLIKVRAFDTPVSVLASPASYTFSMARNEYESFQVICVGPLEGITVQVTLPPSLVGVAPPPQLHSTLYYVNSAGNLSDCNARQGLWPDPLVPFIDVFVGEDRNRTTTVDAHQSRGFWVDFFVPPSSPSGAFTGGSVSVSATGLSPRVLPYTLTVRNFTLPQTSPYATAFLFNSRHSDPNPNASALVYGDLALMHRVTANNMFTYAPQLHTLPPDLAGFEAEYGTFLTGRRLPFGLENTTVTSFQLPSPFCHNFSNSSGFGTDVGFGVGAHTPLLGYCGDAAVNASIELWRSIHDWALQKNVADLLFDYTVDEPQFTHTWTELKNRGAAVHAASPSLRVLTTITMDLAIAHGVVEEIDLWVPQINDVGVKGTCYTNANTNASGNQRPFYNNVSTSNLWWYQACPSHGCGGGCWQLPGLPSGGGYWPTWDCETGWPSYMIDHSAVYNRIHPWATYLYNFGGELYWGMSFADEVEGGDAWVNQWEAGGNGDGTLSYRGTPERIGGKTEVPVASLRLKAIRDGQEDLLYMAAAEKEVGREAVLAVIGSVISSAFSFTDEAGVLSAARDALGALAEGK